MPKGTTPRPGGFNFRRSLKRWGSAALLSFLLIRLLAEVTEVENWFIFLCASVSMLLVDLWMTPAEKRRAGLTALRRIAKEHAHLLLKWGATLVASIVLLSTHPTPTAPDAQGLLQLVKAGGFILWLVAPFFVLLSRGEPRLAISRWLLGLLLLAGALWLIGYAGDGVAAWTAERPGELQIVLLAALVLGLGLQTVRAVTPAPLVSQSTLAKQGSPLTERDLRYAAAHEAGHAYVQAVLGIMPPDFELVLHKSSNIDSVAGFVSAPSSGHTLEKVGFIEAYMLVLLAGRQGELALYPEATLGSTSDLLRWVRTAHAYLGNHCRGIYYLEPANDLELTQNKRDMLSLQNRQADLLDDLFQENAADFRELASLALNKKRLVAEDVQVFARRARLPAGFPAPLPETELTGAPLQTPQPSSP